MQGRLSGKVAVVTGAASGMGRAVAVRFAQQGARVVVSDLDESGGLETLERLRAGGGEGIWVPLDVTQEEQVEALVEQTLSTYGALQVLYNNAGINSDDGAVTDLTVERWERIHNVNLRGLFLTSKYCIPPMLTVGSGAVINVASVGGLIGLPGHEAYTATKGAVVAMTRSMAVTYAAQGVRVNCICPGFIMTPMVTAMGPEMVELGGSITPIGRIGTPEEVAALATFLASDEASFMVGAIIPVDGGYTAQ